MNIINDTNVFLRPFLKLTKVDSVESIKYIV